MPRATRRRASSPVAVPDEEEVEQEVEEEEEATEEDADEEMADEGANESGDEPQQEAGSEARLRFKQELNWRAGRPIAVAELLRLPCTSGRV